MKILEQIKLAPYTTFKIGGPARYFCEVSDQFDALEAFEFAKQKNLPVFVLGGGSNLLISDDGFKGLVIRVVNKGIEVAKKSDKIYLKVAAGENWDNVVEFSVKNGWWGMENLSHIPGSTGAIAVQNVGAYGQEAKNIIDSITVFDTQAHNILELSTTNCGFGYRQSIFNTSQKGRYIIFYVTFLLSAIPNPILSYRDLKARFAKKTPSQKEIRKAVIQIRDKKFPFPVKAKLGNAGSFFKNPIVTNVVWSRLSLNIAKNFGFKTAMDLEQKSFKEKGVVKIPAAFLIEICGLKNLKQGGAAINKNQPLVIVNANGKASAQDVLTLGQKVVEEIYTKIGLNLRFEPEFLGFKKTT